MNPVIPHMSPPPRNPALLAQLLEGRNAPGAAADTLLPLASLWSAALDDVLDAMMKATRDSGRVIWPEDARPEATLELAKLSHFVANKIIDDRLGDRALAEVDVEAERAYLGSPHGQDRAYQTGRILSDRIWSPIYDELVAKYPLLLTESEPQEFTYRTTRRRTGSPPEVTRNHFVPALTTKPWANSQGDVLVVEHWVDGGVRFTPRGFRTWGREWFLYPQWLEAFFQSVESDAATAYKNLLNSVPLPPDQRRIFGTFLVLQMLRTPAFVARIGIGLRAWVTRSGVDFPTDTGSLRRAYETLFKNDVVHAELYAHLTNMRWRMLTPAAGWQFPRVDAGLVRCKVEEDEGSSWLYPLSPERCLCIGPGPAASNAPTFPVPATLSVTDSVAVISQMAAAAVHSVALHGESDPELWRPLLLSHMRAGTSEEVVRYRAWGKLDES